MRITPKLVKAEDEHQQGRGQDGRPQQGQGDLAGKACAARAPSMRAASFRLRCRLDQNPPTMRRTTAIVVEHVGQQNQPDRLVQADGGRGEIEQTPSARV